ncbi:hypothetical protein HMPREF0424_0424 [Gardnerella vaginalis 409-05]|nr:hypothetical protein HMPREF0424_0424 [Gardnerella vaginalis 409-05]
MEQLEYSQYITYNKIWVIQVIQVIRIIPQNILHTKRALPPY